MNLFMGYWDESNRKALEREADLLAQIDTQQAALVLEGMRPAKALKNVLKAYDLSARRYWNMCHTQKEYQETT